jgi:hypothetical protein
MRFPGGWDSQILRKSAIKVARLSDLSTGRFYPQELSLLLISVRGWVNIRATVRPDELCQEKFPVTPSGIDTATFRFVAQCLNHCATAGRVHCSLVNLLTELVRLLIYGCIYKDIWKESSVTYLSAKCLISVNLQTDADTVMSFCCHTFMKMWRHTQMFVRMEQ